MTAIPHADKLESQPNAWQPVSLLRGPSETKASVVVSRVVLVDGVPTSEYLRTPAGELRKFLTLQDALVAIADHQEIELHRERIELSFHAQRRVLLRMQQSKQHQRLDECLRSFFKTSSKGLGL